MNNQLTIQGTITHVLPLEQGVSKSSGKEWKKQTAVLQTQEQYPRAVAFDMFNSRIVALSVGQSVSVAISIESREYQGKWYTNVNALSVTPVQANNSYMGQMAQAPTYQVSYPQAQAIPQAYPQAQAIPASQARKDHSDNSDLPF